MKNSKLTTMIEAIKAFFVKSNGILLLHDQDVPSELRSYYIEITSDLEMKKLSEDKKNMRSDGERLKNDIKKAVAAYHSEFVNG